MPETKALRNSLYKIVERISIAEGRRIEVESPQLKPFVHWLLWRGLVTDSRYCC
jgi:hypothetical protein